MSRTVCALVVLFFLLIGPAAPHPAARQTNGTAPDLASFFGPRGVVRDSNGDALNDSIAARIIVPAAPSREDGLTAANVAARLGFETTSMSLPLVLADHAVPEPAGIEVPILVGRTNAFVRKLVDAGAIDLQSLRPGQGLIAAVRSPLGGGDGLVIVGADDAGTLAAGTHVAGRLPRLWNMTGVTLSQLADQVARHLRARGVEARPPAITSLVVDAERRGIATINVRVPIGAAQSARALTVLQDLDRAHRRGLEPMTLNFAEIGRTSIQLWVDGRSAGTADVYRSGLNARTLTPPIDPNGQVVRSVQPVLDPGMVRRCVHRSDPRSD